MSNPNIEAAVEAFRTLVTEQCERVERMKKSPGATAFTPDRKVRIGLIPGDGIGPIIVAEAERVLRGLLREPLEKGLLELVPIEGLTIENRLALGCPVPPDTLAAIKSCDVLLKGPTTTPKGGSMESANVALRRELDLFANVRPVKIPEQNIDWIFFRENTEGEYILGSRGVTLPEGLCFDFKVTTDPGTERIARAAMNYAVANGKSKVAVVTKANIMKKTDGRFSELCHAVAEREYPTLTLEDWYVDIMSANLVNEKLRPGFEVFLMPNLYGDILTDEAAQIQGGVGTAGSANVGDRYAMFEAIHGSAPRMIEAGLGDYADPTSILRAAEMLLRHIGRASEADRLSAALAACPVKVTGDRDGATCRQFADALLQIL